MSWLEAYIDGACAPVNPGGTASYGVIVYEHSEGVGDFVGDSVPATQSEPTEVWRNSGIVGSGPEMSNNVGEYCALKDLLCWLLSHQFDGEETRKVVVKSDSQLLVNQMSGRWKVRGGLYKEHYSGAAHYMMCLGSELEIEFRWIPREENLADELAKGALERASLG